MKSYTVKYYGVEAPNKRYCDVTVVEHDRYRGGSVTKWACIGLRGRTDLYVIQNGFLTGVSYRDEIMHAGATDRDFILMDDNSRPHRAGVVLQSLQAETIDRMDWSARAPHLTQPN